MSKVMGFQGLMLRKALGGCDCVLGWGGLFWD